jgi:hypothetical protein
VQTKSEENNMQCYERRHKPKLKCSEELKILKANKT